MDYNIGEMAENEQMRRMLGKALGKIPSGLFILCAEHEGRNDAQLVSWVQQASFEPPAISIVIAKERSILGILERSGRAVLCILGQDNHDLLKRYARGVEDGADAFEGVKVVRTGGGLPALADSLAYLECRMLQRVTFDGDHELFIAEVTDAQVLRDIAPFVHVRGNGLHY